LDYRREPQTPALTILSFEIKMPLCAIQIGIKIEMHKGRATNSKLKNFEQE
jgi:hypothetical protein